MIGEGGCDHFILHRSCYLPRIAGIKTIATKTKSITAVAKITKITTTTKKKKTLRFRKLQTKNIERRQLCIMN